MPSRTVDISELTQLSRKYSVACILEQRDNVNKSAQVQTRSAISDWHGVAPRDTGALSNSVSFAKNKSTAYVGITSSRFRLVNILNNSKTRKRKSAGFYDRYKTRWGKGFLNKW